MSESPHGYSVDDLNLFFYEHIYNNNEDRFPRWHGIQVCKMPTDMVLYAMVIQQKRPKWIVETGTWFGGSSLFYQDMLDLVGDGGKVITIDTAPKVRKKDPRITYLKMSSTDLKTLRIIKAKVKRDPVMVVLDSFHLHEHVRWELSSYSSVVTKGQYMVVEDCYNRGGLQGGPKQALDWFMNGNKNFEQTNLDRMYIIGSCRGGWLRRIN